MAQKKHIESNAITYIFTIIKQYVTGITNNKVDKVGGKQLSTNDYTTAEKNKLAGLNNYTLPTASSTTKGGVKVGAGLAVTEDGILSATGGGTADAVEWENVIGKPTKVSQFTNDSGFQTASQVNSAIVGKGYQTADQVNALIQKVVATAPEALDTLQELANALNNDPNFSGTITTELGKKLNTADLVEMSNTELQQIWDSVKV